MTTKLYPINSAASGYIAGTIPNSERSAASADATALLGAGVALMRTLKGSSSSVRSLTTLASAAEKKYWLQSWVSMPLLAQTINPASITISVAGKEPNLAANFKINSFCIFVWRPSTAAIIGYLIDQPSTAAKTTAAEPAAINTNYVMQSVISSGISSVACADGDVLIVENWAIITQASATSYTDYTQYAGTTETTTNGAAVVGTHASFVEFSQTLLFLDIQEGEGETTAALNVSGVGTQILNGEGIAAAVLTVTGAFADFQSGVGVAASSSLIAGVGAATAAGVASVQAVCNVVGVWDLSSIVNQGAGSASMELGAEAVGLEYFPYIFMQESAGPDGWVKEAGL